MLILRLVMASFGKLRAGQKSYPFKNVKLPIVIPCIVARKFHQQGKPGFTSGRDLKFRLSRPEMFRRMHGHCRRRKESSNDNEQTLDSK